MIDFTSCVEELNRFKGCLNKKTLVYNNKRYMVKFYNPNDKKENPYSEYVGSNIFRIMGFEVQNTILGTYNFNCKEKIVCACEDFTDDFNRLCEFEGLALSKCLEKKIDTELSDILEILEEVCNNRMNFEEIKNKFWDMFIVDSLIGNTDRHNGNWGFLLNKVTNQIRFSPIYDCGSCLNSEKDDKDLLEIEGWEVFKTIVTNCYSCLKINGKKINYMSYIKEMSNKDCNKAIIRVVNRIDISKINDFIDNIEGMSTVRKEFYKSIIYQRFLILDSVYNKLLKEDNN